MSVMKLFTACALLALACSSHAQSYPQRPIRLILPVPPGGVAADVEIARKFGELADGMLRAAAVQRVIDEVMVLEKCQDIGAPLALMTAV